MNIHEQLAAHPLLDCNFGYIQPVILKLSPKILKRVEETGKIRNDGIEEIEASEYYHVSVFQKAAALISAVERLEHSLIFIQKLPYPRRYEKKGVHQFSWLEYHYSYFVITYDSLLDIALILTNTIFQLGNNERECKLSVVRDNEWVKRTPVKATIDTLEKLTSSYGKTRNLFLHRGESPSVKSVTESEMLDLLQVTFTVHQHSKPIVPLELVDRVFKWESKKVVDELNNDLIEAHDAIILFFDSLLPVYKNRAQMLKSAI